jgi:hypothetical protein
MMPQWRNMKCSCEDQQASENMETHVSLSLSLSLYIYIYIIKKSDMMATAALGC